jgi:asparagine synthase (glutamine-hydrolysing)
MCGIAGVLGLGTDLGPDDAQAVRRMTSFLVHRGPDDSHVDVSPRAVLGNTRLAVMGPGPGGALPMSAGRLRLCYNGMLTNELALMDAAGLERPPSSSDAATLLRLWERRGPAVLGDINGQFALCMLDEAAGRAWLARDAFGKRPLFLARTPGRLWFASEIKALLEVPGVDRSPDPEAAWHFFSLGYVPGERTAFRGVRELLEGRVLSVNLRSGRAEERPYYRLAFGAASSLTDEEAVPRVREALLTAVERSLRADAPVGLTLSGGVDTSGILGLAQALGRSRALRTYSIAMDEATFDESPYQRVMTRHAGSIHREVRVGPQDVLEAFETACAHLDEPLVNGAAVPLLLLCRAASRDVKVLLLGEGGDEVFNAYETHRAWRARELYRRWVPAPLRALARAAAHALPCDYGKLSLDFVAKRFTSGAELGPAEAHLHWRQVLGEEEKARLLRVPPGAAPPTAALFADLWERSAPDHPVDRLSRLDLRYYLVDDLMVKNDRMAAACGLEARFPYLERPVVELAASLAPDLRLRGLRGRWVQKQALAPFVPPVILRRSNMGLELPHSKWLLGPLRPLARKWLAPDAVEATGLLRADEVARLWEEHAARRRDNGRALWAVIGYTAWFHLFRGDAWKFRLQGAPPLRAAR